MEKLRAENADVVDQANMAMGLSLGEYTALAFAGAISFEDGVPPSPHTLPAKALPYDDPISL